jgi:hypothetical protein
MDLIINLIWLCSNRVDLASFYGRLFLKMMGFHGFYLLSTFLFFTLAKRHECYNWLVVWNMTFIFPYIGNVIIPTDEIIFFRGAAQPPTRQ